MDTKIMKNNHILTILLCITAIPLSMSLWIINIIYSKFVLKSEGFDEPVVISPGRWLASCFIPMLIAFYGYKKKSVNLSGALLGSIVAFALILANFCFLADLLAFFLTSSKATKFRAHLKRKLEDDFKEGGQRNWIQVLCNGGMATQLALLYLLDVGSLERPIDFVKHYRASWLSIGVLGNCISGIIMGLIDIAKPATLLRDSSITDVCGQWLLFTISVFACCNGDTWASELGTVFGKSDPYLVTSFKKVPKGTNGGISLIGTLLSTVGGLVIGISHYLAVLYFSDRTEWTYAPPQWPIIFIGATAGFLGSLIDSIMGATLQYSGLDKDGKIVSHSSVTVKHISGRNILDNHSVNLISTIIMGILIPTISKYLWASL